MFEEIEVLIKKGIDELEKPEGSKKVKIVKKMEMGGTLTCSGSSCTLIEKNKSPKTWDEVKRVKIDLDAVNQEMMLGPLFFALKDGTYFRLDTESGEIVITTRLKERFQGKSFMMIVEKIGKNFNIELHDLSSGTITQIKESSVRGILELAKQYVYDVNAVKDWVKHLPTYPLSSLLEQYRDAGEGIVYIRDLRQQFTDNEIKDFIQHLSDESGWWVSTPSASQMDSEKFLRENEDTLLDYNGSLMYYFYPKSPEEKIADLQDKTFKALIIKRLEERKPLNYTERDLAGNLITSSKESTKLIMDLNAVLEAGLIMSFDENTLEFYRDQMVRIIDGHVGKLYVEAQGMINVLENAMHLKREEEKKTKKLSGRK
jgi:hypothetical protein